jgi:hypothetical protein
MTEATPQLSTAQLKVLQVRISPQRIATYLKPAKSDLRRAVELYDWNTLLSTAFWADISRLEVAMRNAIHERLADWYPGPRDHWFTDARLLTEESFKKIDCARRKGEKKARQVINHRVKCGKLTKEDAATQLAATAVGWIVAEFSFGIWTYLLASNYDETLWKPAIQHAFPHQRSRRKLENCLRQLRQFRNRIAHHEAIFNKEPQRHHAHLLYVAAAICPELKLWIDRTSTVQAVLAQCPIKLRRPRSR